MDTAIPPSGWIQLADDAIKIGLGAIIAGVSAWIVARHNNRGEIQKLKFEKQSKILSDAALIHEEHFQSFYKYTLELVFISKERTRTILDPGAQAVHAAIIATHLQEATKQRFQMAQKIPEAIFVQSQLLLLGEETAFEKSKYLVKLVGEADRSFRFNGSVEFDISSFDNASKEIGRARDEFFKELQNIYKQI